MVRLRCGDPDHRGRYQGEPRSGAVRLNTASATIRSVSDGSQAQNKALGGFDPIIHKGGTYGPATFAAMRDAIGSSRSRIDMESYEFDDQAGSQFADLLIAARDRGGAVYLICDGWGAVDTKSAIFDRLRSARISVLEYNPIKPNSRVPVDLNRRDHRKLLCIDGHMCISGGVNISKVHENAPAPRGTDPDDQAWRDTDVRIDGPVAAQFEQFFAETWREQHGGPLPPAPPPARWWSISAFSTRSASAFFTPSSRPFGSNALFGSAPASNWSNRASGMEGSLRRAIGIGLLSIMPASTRNFRHSPESRAPGHLGGE